MHCLLIPQPQLSTALSRTISNGFTLPELIATLLVTGIILSAAVPAFTTGFDHYRLRAAAERLYGQLQHARLEAIKRNRPVSVTAGADTYRHGTLTVKAGANHAIRFSPLRGTASAGSFLFTSTHGRQIKVVISALGRVRLCAPAGQSSRYPTC